MGSNTYEADITLIVTVKFHDEGTHILEDQAIEALEEQIGYPLNENMEILKAHEPRKQDL